MPNNTETYWDADGTSLHTYAKSITTLGGLGPPKFRGENDVVPTRPGERYVAKTPDANVLTLAMDLRGIAEHATNIDGAPTKAQYQSNWQDLIRTLWLPAAQGRELVLTKRFYDGGVLKTAAANAEFVGGMQPTMIGQKAGRCTVDLKLADPFFYATSYSSSAVVNGNQNITVEGNAPTLAILATINGARTNAKIRNNTAGVEFTFPTALSAGHNVIVGVKDFSAVATMGGAGFDASASVIHSGAPQWLILWPGVNQINVSSTVGTGVITLQWKAAWV
jgi:hypothetical protein